MEKGRWRESRLFWRAWAWAWAGSNEVQARLSGGVVGKEPVGGECMPGRGCGSLFPL